MGEENGRENKITFITPFDRNFPDKLRNIPNAPAGLYVRGMLPVERNITVAVIGARDCSDYGRYVAEGLGTFFGKNGVTVVSGMARGIDGISQRAALEAGGTSIGVLGCGVDICYPTENKALFDRLLEQGTVLSEYPPGMPPKAMNFPARNRIVSGLADAVVVVEARSKSGTLITVDMALEQGREVFVVPGRITDRLSDGCNKLIRQGAEILFSPEEMLEELWELKERTEGKVERRSEKPEERSRKCSGDNRQAQDMQQKNGKKTQLQKEESKGAQTRRPAGRVKCEGVQESQSGMWLNRQASEVPPEFRSVYQALDLCPQSVEQIVTRLPPDISQRQVTMQLIQLCMENKAVQVSPGYFKSVPK